MRRNPHFFPPPLGEKVLSTVAFCANQSEKGLDPRELTYFFFKTD